MVVATAPMDWKNSLPLLQRPQVGSKIHNLDAADSAEFCRYYPASRRHSRLTTASGRKVGRTRPLQPRGANGLMMFKGISRRIGGAQHLDVETLEQRPWGELGLGEFFSDGIVEPGRHWRRKVFRRCQRHRAVRASARFRSAYRERGGNSRRTSCQISRWSLSSSPCHPVRGHAQSAQAECLVNTASA